MSALNLLWTVARCTLFVLLCLAGMRVNLERAKRSRQFLMPFVGIVYCCLALWAAARAYGDGIKTAELLVQLNGWILCGFFVVKYIILNILSIVWEHSRGLKSAGGLCYEYDEGIGIWALKTNLAYARIFMAVIYVVCSVFSALLMGFVETHPDLPAFAHMFYPVAGIIIIGEICFFLGGHTKTEYIEDILGEDEETFHIFHYSALRGIFKNLFPDRVLFEQYCYFDTEDVVTFGSVDEMLESPEQKVKNAGVYYDTLKRRGHNIDMNYVSSSLKLCDGHSVLFYDPFYKDLTDYLVFVMFHVLMSHRRVLVVAGRDGMEKDLKAWIDDSLSYCMDIPEFWKSEILSSQSEGWDIGIIGFSEIYPIALQEGRRKKPAQVGMVFIVEPSRMLAAGQLGITLLLENCGLDSSCVFSACDRNMDGLVDGLSHLFKTSIIEVSALSANTGRSSEMFWDANGDFMHLKIMPGIARYLGVGSEIGAVAIKNSVQHVQWASSEKFPVIDMKWFLGQYFRNFCRYTGLPPSQDNIYGQFDFSTNLWDIAVKPNQFMIVEDEFCNLFEVMRLFETRATEENFVNVISEDYLLRDYMLEHAHTFQNDARAIPSIAPDYARTERNAIIKLLLMMSNYPVKDSYIRQELEGVGIETDDLAHTLQELFEKHCMAHKLPLSVTHMEEFSEETMKVEAYKAYRIVPGGAVEAYMERFRNAYYMVEDGKKQAHYIASKLYGHLYQIHLPGQMFAYNGKYYEVMGFVKDQGVIVRRASEHMDGRRYYRQKKTVFLSNTSPDGRVGSERSIGEIRTAWGFSDIIVSTHGYYLLEENSDMAHAKYININGIPDRTYRNKGILRVILPGASEEVLKTIAILFNEMFRTIYPDTWQYIQAAYSGWDDEDPVLPGLLCRLVGEKEKDSIYFIEDSDMDLGLLVSIERNLRKYLEYMSEYLNWHEMKMAEDGGHGLESDDEGGTNPPQPQIAVKKGSLLHSLIMRLRRWFSRSIVP